MSSFPPADRAAPGATRTKCGELSPLGLSLLFQVGQIVVDSCRDRMYVAYCCCRCCHLQSVPGLAKLLEL